MEHYLFEEHRHNYAVWTAARAVSRNFTSTDLVKAAIENSRLVEFVTSTDNPSQEQFNLLHKTWSDRIISSLTAANVKNVSYGRAAKIIAIYLKTAVIMGSAAKCEKSKVIHPPIDAILLRNILASFPAMTYLRKVRWTQLDETSYWELASRLKQDLKRFDWKLEYYWNPGKE